MLVAWNYIDLPKLTDCDDSCSGQDLYLGNVFTRGRSLSNSELRCQHGPFLYVNHEQDHIEFAVDHLGEASLFFWFDEHQAILSDSIAEVINRARNNGVKLDIERGKLIELFLYRYTTGEQTLVRDIFSAVPGNRYRLRRNVALERHDYWEFSFASDFHVGTTEELVDEFDAIFSRVVKDARVGAKDEVGNMLSGGVDSSFIQAHLNNRFGKGLFSFSLGFPELKKLDESDYAISASELFGTTHEVFPMTRDAFLDNLPRTIYANSYPLQLYHTVPYDWLFRSVPSRITSIFCGYSADLNFGESLRKFWMASKLAPMRPVAGPLLRGLALLSSNDLAANLENVERFLSKVTSVERFLESVPEVDSPYDFSLVQEVFGEIDIQKVWGARIEYVRKTRPRNVVDAAFALSLFGITATVSVWHRLASRAGKQIIFPFADPRIIEFTKNIHPAQKLRFWGLAEKYLMKKAALKYLPRKIVYRAKRTGEFPVSRWMQEGHFDRMLRDLRDDVIDTPAKRIKELSEREGKYNHFLYWNYINFMLWKRHFLPERLCVSDTTAQLAQDRGTHPNVY